MTPDKEVLELATRAFETFFGEGTAKSYPDVINDFITAASSPFAQFYMRHVLQMFAATNPGTRDRWTGQFNALDTHAVRDWQLRPNEIPEADPHPNPLTAKRQALREILRMAPLREKIVTDKHGNMTLPKIEPLNPK